MAMRRRSLSWRTKLLVLLLLFSLVPMTVVAVLGLRSMAQTFEESSLGTVQAVARAKAEAIGQFTDIRRRDVEKMATLIAPPLTELEAVKAKFKTSGEPEPPPEKLPDLVDAEKRDGNAKGDSSDTAPPEPKPEAEAPPAPPSPKAAALETAKSDVRQVLGLLLWDQSAFEELLVINLDGAVLASTFQGHEGKSAAELDYFTYGRKAPYVQPVFRSPITDDLTMMISTPIKSAEGLTLGVLAARLNLNGFYRLINDYTGLGATGETIVGKKIEHEVVFMAPTRHDDSAALQRKLAVDAEPTSALVDASRGQSGRGVRTDYRGSKVLAAWQDIPSLEWGLVTKIDYDEAMTAVHTSARQTALLMLAFAGLVVLASVVAARALVQPLRDLRTATERISKGDFQVSLDNIRSGDELGELADSFERMVAALKYFREHSRRPEEDEIVEDDPAFDPEEPSRAG